MKIFEKLRVKIKNDLGYDCHSFKRTYAGWSQKAAGAPIWIALSSTDSFDIGSQYPAKDLLKTKKLDSFCDNGFINILPDEENNDN